MHKSSLHQTLQVWSLPPPIVLIVCYSHLPPTTNSRFPLKTSSLFLLTLAILFPYNENLYSTSQNWKEISMFFLLTNFTQHNTLHSNPRSSNFCSYLKSYQFSILYSFFIQRSVLRHLGFFHISAIVKSAAMTIGMQMSLLSRGLCPWSRCQDEELLGHMGVQFLEFWEFLVLSF